MHPARQCALEEPAQGDKLSDAGVAASPRENSGCPELQTWREQTQWATKQVRESEERLCVKCKCQEYGYTQATMRQQANGLAVTKKPTGSAVQ